MLATFPSTGVLSKFMGYLNRNLSIEIGKLHDWRGPMWQGRYHHSVVDDDPAIQIERLRYLLEQGVKEGLVSSPTEWPGVHFANALMEQRPLEGLWIDRTAIWSAKNRGESFDAAKHTERTTVDFHPLPCWQHLTPDLQKKRVRTQVKEIERQAAARHQRDGTHPAGARVVMSRSPHHRPQKVKWAPAPRILAASRQARWALWRSLQDVVVAYYHAVERLAEGAKNVRFPEGTFPPRMPYVPSPADLRLGLA
jgi:hypothetical protein